MWNSLPLLVICFALGVWAKARQALPASTSEVLNRLILNIALPAVVIRSVRTLSWSPRLLLAASMMWGVWLGAFALFTLWRTRGLSPKAAGALILTAGFCNTAYLGLPLIEGMLGAEARGIAVVIDQLGSFLAVSTVGIAYAAHSSGGVVSAGTVLKKVVTFPSFIALLMGIALRPLALPDWAQTVLMRLDQLMTPLALISVGFQLEIRALSGRVHLVAAGLAYKLLLAPALVFGLFWLLGGRGLELTVTVLQAAMAPMVAGGVLAMEHDLERPLVVLLLGLGIPLSLITVPVVTWALSATVGS